MSVHGLIRNMETAPPAFDAESAARAARTAFGVDGRCLALAGERDLNFRLTQDDGTRHLLKIWNHHTDRAVVDLQIRAMQHIRRHDAAVPVPAIETDVEGQSWVMVQDAEGRRHPACLLSWLQGRLVREVPSTVQLKSRLGHWLARLDRALAEFQHPAQDRDMVWDLARADRLAALLEPVRGSELNRLIKRTLDDYRKQVLPVLAHARRQVLHGDFNLDNVLVGSDHPGEVGGIVDFGDTLRAPLICDLAIACAYHLSDEPDPLAGIVPVVRAYHAVLPLATEELGVLPGLVRARLVASVVIPSYMAMLHPGNRDYLLVDSARAAELLRRLADSGPTADARRIIQACANG